MHFMMAGFEPASKEPSGGFDMSSMQETRIALPSPGRLFTPGVTIFLVLMIAGFFGSLFAPDVVTGLLALHPQRVLHGGVWQLVTYPFAEGSPGGLICNGLILLFIGSTVEREWRTASFLWLWLVVSVGCAILWVLINLVAGSNAIGVGSTAFTYGLIATMGVLMRGRRLLLFFATVPAQYLAIGMIAIGAILSLAAPMTLVWVLGALVAYAYIKIRWSLGARASARPTSGQLGGGGQFVDVD
jgi:membrane associated rhomboid family serine protease